MYGLSDADHVRNTYQDCNWDEFDLILMATVELVDYIFEVVALCCQGYDYDQVKMMVSTLPQAWCVPV